ncbi:DUF3168 domain-containing protein [Sphingomonas koreensis]
MEEELRAMLLSMADLTVRVGTRIDWDKRSQGDMLPAGVLHLKASVRPMNLAGPGAWARGLVQMDWWARQHKDARDLAEMIARPVAKGGIHGFRGTRSGIRLRVWALSIANDTDTDAKGVVHRARLDCRVWWS